MRIGSGLSFLGFILGTMSAASSAGCFILLCPPGAGGGGRKPNHQQLVWLPLIWAELKQPPMQGRATDGSRQNVAALRRQLRKRRQLGIARRLSTLHLGSDWLGLISA